MVSYGRAMRSRSAGTPASWLFQSSSLPTKMALASLWRSTYSMVSTLAVG